MSNVDERLQVGLREIADGPARSAEEVEQDVLGRMVRRRRQRRRAFTGGTVLGVTLLVAGALGIAQRLDHSEVTVAGARGASAGDGNRRAASENALVNHLLSVAVQRHVEGGENIVFTFAEPLPADAPQALPGIGSVEADPAGISYTTQGADVIEVCGNRHDVFEPAPSTGSVDVFFPAALMAPDFDPLALPVDTGVSPEDPPLDPGGTPGKIVGCGPYNGYVQYSIWVPASDDLEDVDVVITESNRLVVEIRP